MDMFSVRMLRRLTKILERGSPGKLMKQASSEGECVFIRVRGLWLCALFCVPSKQDGRLVTELVNDTMLGGLSVIE